MQPKKYEINHEILTQLLDASRQMAENRTLDTLLDYAMDIALELANAEYGYLILLQDDGTLDFQVQRSKNGLPIEKPEEQISQSILSKVIHNQEHLILADAAVDPKFQKAESVKALRLRSVMCVPLISRGKTIGALYVENRTNKGIFHESMLTPLKYFASQAAVSIENAMLNNDLEARVAARTAELEQAMAQLGQGWTEAVEFNRLRSEWLGKVVHDIRSPLSTIIAGLASFEEGLFGDMLPEQVEWIIKMRRTALHIAKLTEDFFDFTKLELGKLQLYYEGTNLNTYLEEIYQVGRALPWSSRVEFKLELELNLPSIPLDPTRIQQVIINLVSNALKFTEKGEVTLFAHTRHDIGMVIIGVRDTGVGIPPEEIPNMFQRFYQTGSAAMRRKGTGLGLAICRELVELHQGYITLTSKLHQGSTFQFALPIDPDLEKYLEKF